jgi:hypothetical protein
MADFVYNIAKGRTAELYNRVDLSDPTNAVLVVVVIDTSATDGTLQDLDTLTAVLGDANTAEVTNTNYARLVLDDTDLAAFAPDDTNDRVDLDLADFAWTAVAAGDGWTDIVVCYDNDSTGGTDANIVPLTQHDFAVTPDGSDITAVLNASGFFRAS